MSQQAITAVYMRGGTSRALIFHARDLPPPGPERDALILAAMGSPDENGRQLDGMGGGLSSLSKIAIVGPSNHPEADVDYTFGQVAVDAPLVQYKGNCGNISAAIGPFAVEERLVSATGDSATVRIHNTNTGKIIVSRFAVERGRPVIEGSFSLPGVAGTAAPIELAFQAPGGAVTGTLLPTGNLLDSLDVPGLGKRMVSLVDASNPVVFVSAEAMGLQGTETPAGLDADKGLLARCEALRVAAACAMGLVESEEQARTQVRNLPLVAIVSTPCDSATLDGKRIPAHSVDILVRMISAGQPHRATPLTGGMCLAAALRMPGTIPHQLATYSQDDTEVLRIGHPSGVLQVAAKVGRHAGRLHVEETVVYRSARRLMQGQVLVSNARVQALVSS